MGNFESKGNKCKIRNKGSASQGCARGNTENDIKDVLLLYKASDRSHRQAVRSFRDALIQEGHPWINISNEVNLSDNAAYLTEDLQWLSQLNHVVLVRLSPDAVSDLEHAIREKKFIGTDKVLHDKVMAVSFGQNLPNGWLPTGVRRRTRDEKDFCFGFKDESNLTIEDFMSDSAQGKLNKLVATIVATN